MSGDSRFKYDVFLSYASEDRLLIAPIADDLTSAGLKVWWDQRINPGAEFDRTIEDAIAASRVVVVVWTKNSILSEWVRAEAAEGLRRGNLVPISIDGSEPPLAFRRRQTLSDTDQLLGAIQNTESQQDLSPPSSTLRARPQTNAARLHVIYLTILGCIGLAVATAALWTKDAAEQVVAFTHTAFLDSFRDPIPYAQGLLAISPSGDHWAYAGSDPAIENNTIKHLYIKSRQQPQGSRIANTQGAMSPFFSWDGEQVGYYARGALWRVSVAGGRPSEVARIPGAIMGSAWCEDEYVYFSNGYRSPLRRVSVANGTIETIMQLPDEVAAMRQPTCLPGNKVAYMLRTQVGSGRATGKICLLDPVSKASHCPIEGFNPRYTSTRHGIVYRRDAPDGPLWFAALSDDNSQFVGAPQFIAEEIGQDYQISQSDEMIWSNNFEYFLMRGENVKNELRLLNEGREAWSVENTAPGFARISNGGNHVAVAERKQAGSNIWIYNFTTGVSRQVTFEGASQPIWSPADDALAYWQPGVGINVLKLQPGAEPETIVHFPHHLAFPNQWTEAGILYSLVNTNTNGDIYFRRNDGETVLVDGSDAATTSAEISPDGNWIAFSSEETGRMEVFVRRFPDGRQRWQVSPFGGDYPRWALDGNRLYFQSGRDVVYIDVDTKEEFASSDPVRVARVGMPGYWLLNTFDISKDARKMVLLDYAPNQVPTVTYRRGWEHQIGSQ